MLILEAEMGGRWKLFMRMADVRGAPLDGHACSEKNFSVIYTSLSAGIEGSLVVDTPVDGGAHFVESNWRSEFDGLGMLEEL